MWFFFSFPGDRGDLHSFPTRRSSDLGAEPAGRVRSAEEPAGRSVAGAGDDLGRPRQTRRSDRKSTRLNSSHANISYAVFCLRKITTRARGNCTPGVGQRPVAGLARTY